MITVNGIDENCHYELLFNGNKSDYKKFIEKVSNNEFVISLENRIEEYYPINFKCLEIKINEEDKDEKIKFSILEDCLELKSGINKINILMESMNNLTTLLKTHFVIDKFGNDDIIDQDNVSIILNIE